MYVQFITFDKYALNAFQGKFMGFIVPEASARFDVDDFYTAHVDHFYVCRPESRASSTFCHLSNFITGVLEKVSISELIPCPAPIYNGLRASANIFNLPCLEKVSVI